MESTGRRSPISPARGLESPSPPSGSHFSRRKLKLSLPRSGNVNGSALNANASANANANASINGMRRGRGGGGAQPRGSVAVAAAAAAAARRKQLPKWISKTCNDVIATPEWSSFTSALYDEVKKYLRRNHIGSFTDLSIDEREHLVQEIENSLASTAQYHDFANALNLQLETRLSEVVQKEAPDVSAVFSHHRSSSAGTTDGYPSSDDESKHPQAIPGGPNGILSPSHRRHKGLSPPHSSFGASPAHSQTSPSHVRSPSNQTVHSVKRTAGPRGLSASVSMLDCLVDTAADAAVVILETMDDVKEELKMLFNTRFPTAIRRFLWRVKLRDDVQHLRYADIFATEHKSTVSVADAQIARICAAIVDNEFPSLAVDPVFVTALTSLVSFSDVVKKNGLQYWVPYVAIPLLAVFSELYSNRALLVEYFFQVQQAQADLLHTNEAQRNYQKQGGPAESSGLVQFDSTNEKEKALFRLIDSSLQEHCGDLHAHLRRVLSSASTQSFSKGTGNYHTDDGTPGIDGAVFNKDQTAANVSFVQEYQTMHTELQYTGPNTDLLIGVFCRKAILQLLVGVLNLDAAIFVWDQCLILGFEGLLPVYLCATLQVLQEPLLEAASLSALWRVLYRQAHAVTWRNLQRVVKEEFLAAVARRYHIEPRDDKLWHEMERGMRRPQDALLRPVLQPTGAGSPTRSANRNLHDEVGDALRALGVHDALGGEIKPDTTRRGTMKLWSKKANFLRRLGGARRRGHVDAGQQGEGMSLDTGAQDAVEQQEGGTDQVAAPSPAEQAEESFFMMPDNENEKLPQLLHVQAGTGNKTVALAMPQVFATASMPKTQQKEGVPQYPSAVEPQDRLQDVVARTIQVNAATIAAAAKGANNAAAWSAAFLSQLRQSIRALVPGLRDDDSPPGPLLALGPEDADSADAAASAASQARLLWTKSDRKSSGLGYLHTLLREGSHQVEAPKLHFHVFRNGARDEAPLLPEEKAALHGLVEFELRRARVLARVAQRRAGQVNGTAAKVVQRPWLATVSGKPWDIAGIGAAVLDFSMHAVRFARQKMVLSLTLRGTVSRIQRTVRRRMLWRSIPNLWKTSNPSADAVVALEKLHVGVPALLWREGHTFAADSGSYGAGDAVDTASRKIFQIKVPPGPALVAVDGSGKGAVGLDAAATGNQLADSVDPAVFRTLPQLQAIQVGMHVLSCSSRRVSHLSHKMCLEWLVEAQSRMRYLEFSWQPDVVVEVPPGPLGLELKADPELNTPVLCGFKPINPNGAKGPLESDPHVFPGLSLVHIASRAAPNPDGLLADAPWLDIMDSRKGVDRYEEALQFLRTHAAAPKTLVMRVVCSNATLASLGVQPPAFVKSSVNSGVGNGDESLTKHQPSVSQEPRITESNSAADQSPAEATTEQPSEAQIDDKEAAARAEAQAEAKARAAREPLVIKKADFLAASRRRKEGPAAGEALAIEAIHAAVMGTRLLLAGTDVEWMDCLEHSAKEVDATREDPLEVAYGEKFQRQYLKSITKGGSKAQTEANDKYQVRHPQEFRQWLQSEAPSSAKKQEKVLESEIAKKTRSMQAQLKKEADKRMREQQKALKKLRVR